MSLNALHCVETPYLSLTWFHLDLNVKEGGGGLISGWMYARGGGGSFRCVLCATGGVGGSKNQEKMRT